ncbi:MAG: hypothetical protein HQM14_07020 [SAR324 cluster bacterium]|nr:hypothetical protein [SAR324 cluster bacterium]
MKNLRHFFLFWIILWSIWPLAQARAGTIAVPSIFVLHRPLNPALITRTTGSGFAYGGGLGNRDLLNSAPSNCELKGYSKCNPDKSSSRFAYSNWGDLFYFQLENMTLEKREGDNQQAYSINFNQSEYDAMLSMGLKFGFLSVGTYYRETELQLREFFVDFNGSFSSTFKTETTSPGYGIHLNIGDVFHMAYYQDGPTAPKNKNQQGRDFELHSAEGFRGGGLGFRIDLGGPEERPDEINIEFFQLSTESPIIEQPAALVGLNFEIILYSFVFYSLILQDVHNNYFSGELLRDGDVSFATGIGWNGEWLQILAGRDPRYFAGIDGGVQLVTGFQF